jgi:DNA phosphorothioation-dependent restriction protein DptH
LFFKPANTEVSAFADILSKATQTPKKEWEQRLTNLQKGQCWSLGQVMTSSGQLKEEAVLVNVTSLESRFLSKKD